MTEEPNEFNFLRVQLVYEKLIDTIIEYLNEEIKNKNYFNEKLNGKFSELEKKQIIINDLLSCLNNEFYRRLKDPEDD